MLTPEFKLLLSCSKLYAGENELSADKVILHDNINEDLFIELIDRHAVAPLAYKKLKTVIGVSDQLMNGIKLRVQQNQLISLSAMSMIVRLQKKMDEFHIRGLFLKGIPLAAMYYGDIALRESMDIDLWVERKGFSIISDYLSSLGYQSDLDLKKFNKTQINYKFKTDHHLIFSINKPGLPPVIELHWKIKDRFGAFTFNPETDFDSTAKYEIAGISVSVFNHIDNFLYLCTHGCEHAWYRLKWLFDLPQLMSLVNYNWEDVQERAIELNCQDQLKLTFLLLKKLLGYEIPPPLRSDGINSNMKSQLSYIKHCILYRGQYCDTFREKLLNIKYFFSINKKGVLNSALLLRYFTSENDWKMFPLPEKLFFLYFPLRPFLLIWRRVFQ
jgi:hypothetical protein